MYNIEKIILASHPLREYGDYGSSWPSCLLKYYIQKVSKLPVKRLVPPNFMTLSIEDDFVTFDYVKFFKFYNIEYNREKWGELFYIDEFNESAYNYMKSIFDKSLVIAYEMEDSLLQILDKLNIPYINMYISPIRFLEDQLFCMTSNIQTIYEKLLEYKLPEEIIEIQANYLKSFYLMKDCKKITKEKSVLFLGQTKYDRSLIKPDTGEIYSILNHKDEFEQALEGYDNILYKRHPKVFEDDDILKYLKSIGNLSLTDENFYSLISRPNIKKVIAISSGGLNEAKYFGKDIKYLLHSSVELQEGLGFDKNKYINIYEHFFSLHFWADILVPIINTTDFSNEFGFYRYSNKLRNSRGRRDYWGYSDLNHEMVKEELFKLQSQNEYSKMSIYFNKILRILYHSTNNKAFLNLMTK